MITLALGMVVWGLAQRWVSLTQGDNGISNVPRPRLDLRLVRSADGLSYYYFALVGFAVVCAALCSWSCARRSARRWF